MSVVEVSALERAIVRQCSPTLAALKPASLFTFPGKFLADEPAEFSAALAARSRLTKALEVCSLQLREYGIRMRTLVWRPCGTLIYVYRPEMLTAYLADPRAADALRNAGYPIGNLEGCIDLLAAHIARAGNRQAESCSRARPCPCGDQGCDREFPHELGYFLGYPYADVAEFIRQRGKNYLAVGLWKVYSERERALATFARYKRCARTMMRAYRRHGRLAGLAVRA